MGRNWRGAVVALSIAGAAGAIAAQAAPAPSPAPAVAPARPASPAGSSLPSSAAALANGAPVVAVGSGGGAFADSIVSFNVPAMTVKAAFTRPGANFTGAPVIFSNGAPAAPAGPSLLTAGRGGGRGGGVTAELVAAQGSDGRIYVLDSDLSTILTLAAPAAPAGRGLGLVTWLDNTGQRWLLSASTGALSAYKVAISTVDVSLSKAWSQGGLSLSSLPTVANGVVFASSAAAGSGAPAAKPNTPKGLYAFDGKTGARM